MSDKRFKVLFSKFGEGGTTDHANCSSGADGGAGVSCNKLFIDGTLGTEYDLNIENTNGNKWEATVTDTDTDKTKVIGSWTVSDDHGQLKGSGLFWEEHWAGSSACDDRGFPYRKIHFSKPTTQDGDKEGRMTNAETDVEPCPNVMTSTKDRTGVTLEGGY